MKADYQGKVTLVLGAGGFIGRWVSDLLVSLGARVHRCLRPGAIDPGLWGARGPSEPHRVDLREPTAVGRLLAQVRPHILFNLCGYGVHPSQREPSLAEALNVRLPQHLIEAIPQWARPWQGQALIHVGSALEYGKVPTLDPAGPHYPETLYGRTKLRGTETVAAASAKGLRASVARLFTVYGPGADPTKLWPLLRAQRAGTEPIPLTEGLQRRDFTYVEDVAQGLARLGLAERLPPVLNLASGRLNSVRDFVEEAAAQLSLAPGRLHFGAIPGRSEEMAHAPVDPLPLERAVGWKPSHSLAEGLALTMKWEGALRG